MQYVAEWIYFSPEDLVEKVADVVVAEVLRLFVRAVEICFHEVLYHVSVLEMLR